ncbi:hypothetical protein CANARDRAFT_7060 [[Candida] arabinofermentans NRRL YB-2248]|uniref:Mitochondrial presequence protease n=1 Tax=[Candida] arabinofermentans NRRL YB-2248 TaxID=983967 RepID=A0A1E4T1T5_9ASCO|nr:hypothetical protein CANARDRAFT_7060 [[Candida] arabinofermentans NRRL YB-2248]
MVSSFFKVQSKFKVDYAAANVKKWRSSRTGLQLTLIDQESPIVEGYFAVATEILNDSGCPHTLEHLIFMGSKKYPYKGLLDVLGNLAFSSTNAWTATDQTVYTLTTAGWDGFKMLLPVYLDHLVNPTLTDEACYTEVYHVDGEAKDKGVVYSEMQGIENQSWFISNLANKRILYKNSGYRSETGGLTKNLRTLTNKSIKEYHRDNYRPENLCIVVTGTIDEQEFLNIMTQFDSELPDLPQIPNKRPFLDTEKDLPLSKRSITSVEFPDKDESSSELLMTYIGPSGKDTVVNQAVDILGSYLTSSSVSLFNKHFIEIDHPLATSAEYYTEDYINTEINIGLSSVPTEEIDALPEKVLNLMKENCCPENFDLVRVRDLLEQAKWRFIFDTEKSSESFSTIAIYEFLYGDSDGSSLEDWMKDLREFDILEKWDTHQWLEVFEKYFIQNHPSIIIAKPSASLYKKLKIENKKLIDDRKAELGEKGLKDLESKLKKALERNDKHIPDEILDAFGQPDPSKINFVKSHSIAVGLNKDVTNDLESDSTKKVLKDTPADFPLYLHIEDVSSNFITIDMLFSSFEVDERLINYFGVFKTLLELPVVNEDGSLTPYDEVIKQLKRDTISSEITNSYKSNFDELVNLKMTVKYENYAKAIEWFHKLMFKTKFTKERVKVIVEKLVNSLPEHKRSGTTMLNSLCVKHNLTSRSLDKATDELIQEEFYKSLLEKINNDEFESIENDLELFRSQLFTLSNTRVVIVGDVSKMAQPVSLWESFISTQSKTNSVVELPQSYDVLSEEGLKKSLSCYIITTPGSESSYLDLFTTIPVEYLSDDAFKILLASEYLQCVEGPFWKGIRGTGLAYGANLYKSVELGQLYFSVYRGADVEKCFDVANEIVTGYANGTNKIDNKMIQGAISSIVNSITNSQSNAFDAASKKFFDNVLVKRGPDYNTKLMSSLSKITADDLVEMYNKYFVKLFDPMTSSCFVSCNPTKSNSIVSHFINLGYNVIVEHANVEDASEDDDSEEEGSDDSDDDDSDDE